MNTLTCIQPGEFAYSETALPEIKENHSILEVQRIGICGTDLHAFEGTQPYFEYPRILGHELAANIYQTGAPGFSVGEPVTIIPYFNCGACIACRNNKPNCCVQMKVCGVHVHGGMRQFLSVPDYALVKADGLDVDQLALVEPLSIGAHSIKRAAVNPGEFVLVIGAGPIGLGTMEFARIAGAHVIAADINDSRLSFCRNKGIAEYTINAKSEDMVNRLQEITSGDMPTVVIDATGSLKAIESSFKYLAHGGRYVMVGLQKQDISFSHPEFHKREATLMSSRNATRSDFEHVIQSMKKGLVNPATYITHRIKFTGVSAQFSSILDPANAAIKAIIEMD